MKEYEKAKAKLIKEAVSRVEVPPRDFSRDYDVTQGLIGAATLGTLGWLGGSSVGIAAFGTAISGAWAFAPVLAVLGLFAGRK